MSERMTPEQRRLSLLDEADRERWLFEDGCIHNYPKLQCPDPECLRYRIRALRDADVAAGVEQGRWVECPDCRDDPGSLCTKTMVDMNEKCPTCSPFTNAPKKGMIPLWLDGALWMLEAVVELGVCDDSENDLSYAAIDEARKREGES